MNICYGPIQWNQSAMTKIKRVSNYSVSSWNILFNKKGLEIITKRSKDIIFDVRETQYNSFY